MEKYALEETLKHINLLYHQDHITQFISHIYIVYATVTFAIMV